MRTAVTAALVCAASWIGLWIGAGWIGLSRSVAVSPLTLVEVPLGPLFAAIAAFVIASLPDGSTGRLRPTQFAWWPECSSATSSAPRSSPPSRFCELEVLHAPVVFAAITALGLQPLAAFLGAWLSRRA